LRKSRDYWRAVLGEVIAELRGDADLTQTELGALMGWHRSKVAKLEAGVAGIEAAELVVLAEALKTTAARIMERVERRAKS
jgi:transcriptional regulator with XRE-family HTH domain